MVVMGGCIRIGEHLMHWQQHQGGDHQQDNGNGAWIRHEMILSVLPATDIDLDQERTHPAQEWFEPP